MSVWWKLAPVLSFACATAPVDGDDTDDTDVETDETDADTDDTDVETDDTDDTDVDHSDDTVTTGCRAQPGRLTIGTGEAWDEFTALTPGQAFEMVNGPQGGWHLTVAVRVEHVDELAVIEVRVTDLDAATVVSADDPFRFNAVLTPLAGPGEAWDCAGSHTNMQAVLDFAALGAEPGEEDPWARLCGHDARIDVTIRDPDLAVVAEEQVLVVVQPDPANGAHCVLEAR